jgi:two-component system cell cycle sensor histidine kinase/response regulator CckA
LPGLRGETMSVKRRRAAVREKRAGGRIPLRAYVAVLVVLFMAVAAVNVVYQRQASLRNARQSALAAAGYSAQVAAGQIAAALTDGRAQVAALAAQPTIRQAFGPAAATGCTLQFGAAGGFSTGHIDIVRADGTVTCSSLQPRQRSGYAGSTWLAAALKGPVLIAPTADARTGQQAVVVAAPVPGEGAVAVFLNLAPLGPTLATELGGAANREFAVTATTTAGPVVLARSIQPGAWAGKPVAGTPFAGAAGQADHRDLNGTPRLYGQAVVPGIGWRVFAGASTAATYAAAGALSDRQILITLVGLAVLFAAALVLYRRIAWPIAVLAAGVRSATAHLPAGPVPVAGPAEVAALAGDVNQLIAASGRELEVRSQLAAVAESSVDAILGMTPDGVVTSWNAGAEQMFGYSREEMTGTGLAVLVGPGRSGGLLPLLKRIGGGETVTQAETKARRKDGTLIDVTYTLSPLRGADGAVIGAASVVRDVTERNRAEADRQALEHRLRQSERLESLGQLASGIAHDFNNLLSAIMNYAAFAAEGTEKPEVRADVQQIQSAAERAARLTRQLLTFARREPAQAQPLDLAAIVDDIRNLLSRSIGAHIELIIELATDVPDIVADRGQVEQVLLNLAINARDAMPGGGSLTITTSLAELDEAYCGIHPGARPGRYAELAVADTGTGISAEVVSHIFDPFFTTKPEGLGTGLGLSTVYGIITSAGGSISLDSEPGAGTTFRLYFPVATSVAASAAAEAADQAKPQAMGNGQTILVVDDEPGVLASAARILRGNGYATLEAASYEQAITLAETSELQLLLTDSVMPRMSGAALADRITGLRPGVPVLYMTGYGPGAAPGGSDPAARIQKPFTAQTLLQAVQQALNAG